MSDFTVIGLGPGDPELITLKGYKKLMNSDIIFYPETSLKIAEKILTHYNIDKNKFYSLNFPIGSKNIDKIGRDYALLIKKYLDSGKNVVYAVEGEPLLYSTFIDIMKYIDFDFNVIPGISSINGLSAQLKLILSTKNETLLIIPAVDDYDYMKSKILSADNIVLLKITRSRETVKRIINELNIKNYYIMSYVSMDNQKIYYNVDDIKDYMTVMVIKRYT